MLTYVASTFRSKTCILVTCEATHELLMQSNHTINQFKIIRGWSSRTSYWLRPCIALHCIACMHFWSRMLARLATLYSRFVCLCTASACLEPCPLALFLPISMHEFVCQHLLPLGSMYFKAFTQPELSGVKHKRMHAALPLSVQRQLVHGTTATAVFALTSHQS